MFDQIDYGPGVTHRYIDFYPDPGQPLLAQIGSCKEDLIQIRYGGQYTLDVGFYPEMKHHSAAS